MKNGYIYVRQSDEDFETVLDNVKNEIEKSGNTIFAVFDHAENARQAGLELENTTVIAFGNPKAGTALMVKDRAAALELPLKILIWKDVTGKPCVAYVKPERWSEHYGLQNEPVIEKMSETLKKITDWATGKNSKEL